MPRSKAACAERAALASRKSSISRNEPDARDITLSFGAPIFAISRRARAVRPMRLSSLQNIAGEMPSTRYFGRTPFVLAAARKSNTFGSRIPDNAQLPTRAGRSASCR